MPNREPRCDPPHGFCWRAPTQEIDGRRLCSYHAAGARASQKALERRMQKYGDMDKRMIALREEGKRLGDILGISIEPEWQQGYGPTGAMLVNIDWLQRLAEYLPALEQRIVANAKEKQ